MDEALKASVNLAPPLGEMGGIEVFGRYVMKGSLWLAVEKSFVPGFFVVEIQPCCYIISCLLIFMAELYLTACVCHSLSALLLRDIWQVPVLEIKTWAGLGQCDDKARFAF